VLDLTTEERALLNHVGPQGRIFRQAEYYILYADGNIILDAVLCKSLIEKKYLRQVQNDDEAWVYMAESRMFEPNYIVEHYEE